MFQRGAGGEVTVCDASNALALKVARGGILDLDVAAISPILYDPDHTLGIWAVHFLVTTDLSAANVTVHVGTFSAANGAGVSATGVVVGTDNNSLFNDTTKNQGSVLTPTMTTTLRGTVFKTGGRPVIPKGDVLCARVITGSSNTGEVVPLVTYFVIEPGV